MTHETGRIKVIDRKNKGGKISSENKNRGEKMKEVRTTLLCSNCFKEAPMKILYIGNSMAKITCESCGYTIKVAPEEAIELYLDDLKHRILTKPLRIAKEIRKDSFQFISTFPLRVITKPLRVAREIDKSMI
ncbi:bh protein [Candidatus Aerophobetes bacterium]|nr:bh protein [Candidatus Aerophobetes bacterium]